MSDDQTNPDLAATLALASELRALIGKLKRRLKEQTDIGNLTWSQVSVLVRLEQDGPATVSTLARDEGMRPQSMGAITATLEETGLITGKPDPTDGRQTILSITQACRDLIQSARASGDDWLFHALQKTLSAPEQEELARAVTLLKRLVDS